MKMRIGQTKTLLSATLLLAAMLSGCGQKGGEGGPGDMMIPVIAAEARIEAVVERLSLVGTLQANEMVTIKSEIEGMVVEIGFQEGEAVEGGKLLLRLDETKLAAALAEAESNFKLSGSTLERSKQLYNDHLIPQQEYDEAAARYTANEAAVERRRRELKDTRIYAPFGGVLGARLVSPGQVIAPATVLTTLVDLDPMKAEVHVPERFLSQVKLGQDLQLTVAAYPGRPFAGQVYFIAPEVDPATRTALVKARVDNREGRLKAGMFASLDLTLQVREKAVVIPESSLVLTQNKTSVWVIGEDDTVQPCEVKVGLRMPGTAEILEGLKPGERVVVEGVQKVMPGAKVATGGLKAAPPPGTAPGAQVTNADANNGAGK
jgi:membrane fusion protein (multidrug efflux system)